MKDTEVSGRVSDLETRLDNHVHVQAAALWENGQAWGRALEARLDDHDTRIRLLEQGAAGSDDPVVGSK